MSVKASVRIQKYLRMYAEYAQRWYRTASLTDTPVIAGLIGLMAAAMLFAAFESRDRSGDEATDRKPATPVATVRTTPSPAAANGEAPKNGVTPSRVTITGCLERSDEAFRLTDTTGTNAPTARSWKSGFLKKRNAHIEVVDSVKGLNLARHVGERVSLTGTLVDKEMRAGSLQRVSSSCSAGSKSKA